MPRHELDIGTTRTRHELDTN